MTLNPTLIWLLIGSALCAAEFVLPTAYVAFMMGISALLVGLVSLLLPQLSIQILLWIGCSTLLIFWVPRWFPTSKPGEIRETLEAQTISAIPAGQTGRVLFEGNSWRARCADPQAAIAPNQKVYVVRREGTTLVVLPEDSVS